MLVPRPTRVEGGSALAAEALGQSRTAAGAITQAMAGETAVPTRSVSVESGTAAARGRTAATGQLVECPSCPEPKREIWNMAEAAEPSPAGDDFRGPMALKIFFHSVLFRSHFFVLSD